MLDEKTLEWLETRKNLCTRCSKREYCRTGNRHHFSTTDCRFWDVYAPGEKTWRHILKKDYKDAAEFEARVAAKLASPSGPEPCEQGEIKHCKWAMAVIEGKRTCSFCRMKYARIEVEQEMDEKL